MAKPCGVNHVATGVDGNSHQPCLFAAVPAKTGNEAVGLDKGFLYRVLGQRGIVQLDIAQAKQIGLVLFNQSDEPLPGRFSFFAMMTAMCASPPILYRRCGRTVCSDSY